MKRIALAAATLAAAAITMAGAGAASAAVHPALLGGSFTAAQFTVGFGNHHDNGGNGPWGIYPEVGGVAGLSDTVTITFVGNAAPAQCGNISGPCFEFAAVSQGSGDLFTIPGDFAPNQGPGHTGQKILRAIDVQLMPGSNITDTGFYSTGFPDSHLNGHTFLGDGQSFGNVPALAFGTPLTGFRSQESYIFTYSPRVSAHVPFQGWTDSSSNGDGQLPGDGQITG